MAEAVTKSNNELAVERTDLAVYRTALAASRSLMAWVRTGLSMIGFGFTIFKFLDAVSDRVSPDAARNAGLFLVGLGTVSVIFGSLEYWQFAKELKQDFQAPVRRFPLLMAAAVFLIGLAIFAGGLARIL